MSAGDRFALIIIAITTTVAILGFFIRRMINQSDHRLEANTTATDKLADNFGKFLVEQAKINQQVRDMERDRHRHRRPWR